jgi:ribose/xylose/arabinose/galactoside ABC-type transport system permease subunit
MLNGFIVCRAAIHPLIVTLGVRYIAYAASSLYTQGFIQMNTRADFLLLGRSSIASVPVPALILLSTVILLQVVLRLTVAGKAIQAIGNNERAAVYSGVRTQFFRILTYTISGACAAMAGMIIASRSGAAAPDTGQGYELEAIAAVAVGGISLTGGSGSLWNALLGTVLFGVLNNLLVLARQPYEIHRIIVGGLIVASLAVHSVRSGKLWRR